MRSGIAEKVMSLFHRDSPAPMELAAGVCDVRLPSGRHYLVTCLPHEHVFKHGLANEAIMGEVPIQPRGNEPIDPSTFKANPLFIAFLHRVLAEYAAQCPGLIEKARRIGDGWVYIIDGRCPDPAGTVDPEDIIGAVEARGGRLIPGSYKGSAKHVLVSKRGVFRLDPWFGGRLLQELLRLKVK